MDVIVWEQGDYLVHHILEEGHDAVVSATKNGTGRPVGTELDGIGGVVVGAGKTGIGLQYGTAVAGDIHLGDDVDETLGSVFHNVLNLLLGVVAAVGALLAFAGRVGLTPGLVVAVNSPGTHIVELGIFGYLDTPPMVVGKVPVKLVHLVGSHQIEVLLYLADAKEMTRHVEKTAAPMETGIVLDMAEGKLDPAIANLRDILGEHLHE